MSKKIVVLAGDGVGPEVTGEAVRVLRAVSTSHRLGQRTSSVGVLLATQGGAIHTFGALTSPAAGNLRHWRAAPDPIRTPCTRDAALIERR